MLLRPACANWFELLTERDALTPVLRCLAATGRVELQAHTHVTTTHLLPALRASLDEYRRLEQRYAIYWPPAVRDTEAQPLEPPALAAQALEHLRAWARAADPIIVRLQQLEHERSDLTLLQPLLATDAAALPNLELFAGAGPLLASRIYVLAANAEPLAIPPAVLTLRLDAAGRRYLLAVGPSGPLTALEQSLEIAGARRLELPPALGGGGAAAPADVLRARLGETERLIDELRASLNREATSEHLAAAIADLELIEWIVERVPDLPSTDHFVWITGWTSDATGARLEAALRHAKLHHLLRVLPPPRGLTPPVVLDNPRWVQPFELFERLLGVPGSNEADPSLLLALIAPIIFGFMFGDVGQGAVLVIAGLMLRKRYPATALLVPGGLASIGFGVLFGSVFALDEVLPPLWVRPMDRPLTVLGASLAGGAVVIFIGLALDGLEHAWQGLARRWWATRAGLVLAYLAMVGSAREPKVLWLLVAGVAWFCIGSAAAAPSRLRALAAALGESFEVILQLFVNTLSFVRVGAFALAHAGLCAALESLVRGVRVRALAFLALLFGNLVLIAVEGLVAGIQTTRLVLFEFFIRFLRADGRPFRPLQSPAFTNQPPRKSP